MLCWLLVCQLGFSFLKLIPLVRCGLMAQPLGNDENGLPIVFQLLPDNMADDILHILVFLCTNTLL